MMPLLTIICGGLLVAVGVLGYTGQEPNPETGKVSVTALIPALIGGLLVVLGLIAFGSNVRKHAMHTAAIVGLVGLVGGFMPIIRQITNTGSFDPRTPSAISGELTILICAIFLVLCVKSFIDVRKARKAAGGTV